MKRIELQGIRFGRWTILEHHNSQQVLAKCDCGTTRITTPNNIRRGSSISCGCHRSECNTVRLTKHKETKSKLHGVWMAMRKRCNYTKHKSYKDYGGRGITVCDEWNDYVSFRNWALGNGYAEGLSIDRKMTDGNYEPSNCQWSDRKTQNNNKRNNHVITINGVSKNVSQWAEEIGVLPSVIHGRINRGWTELEILLPSKGRGTNARKFI